MKYLFWDFWFWSGNVLASFKLCFFFLKKKTALNAHKNCSHISLIFSNQTKNNLFIYRKKKFLMFIIYGYSFLNYNKIRTFCDELGFFNLWLKVESIHNSIFKILINN